MRVIAPTDSEWPERLNDLAATPAQLWVVGKPLNEATARSIAVIGCRAASDYGNHIAADWSHELARAGYGIVSSGAYGIDGAAHRGALAADDGDQSLGSATAVLPCGIDFVYPAGHRRLLEMISEKGTLVSEYPPGTPVTRGRFMERNRLVAALAEAVVVVESPIRGGTADTIDHAVGLSRSVLAVPGPITSRQSKLNHQLIRDGRAVLAATVNDVIDTVAGKARQRERT